ncbi:MAG: hypothetical protein V1769_06130 [Thermoplasmatota archaeon]|jgi:hypothetical protein
MVNREALPLIVGLLIPLALVGIIILRTYGFDIFLLLGQINILYYIVIFPIALGLIAALLNRKKE